MTQAKCGEIAQHLWDGDYADVDQLTQAIATAISNRRCLP